MNTVFKRLLKRLPFLLILWASTLSAMSVQPTVIEMSTAGQDSRANVRVINSDRAPLPIEIGISRIELDPNGKVREIPAGDEFLVFPPQRMIPAGATQTFRIQWVGEPDIRTSQNYLFAVKQLAVKKPDDPRVGVKLVFNFAVVVNVRPPQGNAELALVQSGIARDEKGKLRPMLVVRNNGNIHANLSDAMIRLNGNNGGWVQNLSPAALRQRIGVGLVQPGKSRRFLLPIDIPANVNHLAAVVDYRYQNK